MLNVRFGISGAALEWYDNYLRPRSMMVNVGAEYSTKRYLDFSVPQGSGAGPMLYSAYASTMQDVVPTSINIHGYADDHILKKSFAGASRTEEATVLQKLEELTISIKSWMNQNRLKMNTAKTEFIIIGSRQQLCKVETSQINVDSDIITKSRSIKYLGADLDERLNFKTFITRKCRVAMANLHKLKLIRKTLTQNAAKTIALGLVIAHLDYANALYSGLPEVDIKKLQRVQSMAAKIVTGARKYDSTTQALKSLHWLPVKLRIMYKVLLLVFKSQHNLAPNYLREIIRAKENTRSGLRSGQRDNILDIPCTKNKTFADRSFSVNGPRLWNDLPDELRSLTDLQSFKNKLKTHLFQMF